MSKISLAPDASGSGIFTIASPNSNTNRTLTLPDDTGTIVTNSGNQAGSFTTLNTSGAVVFNDAGADVDFRVEGDTNANLLFVDASTDRIGIGTNAPTDQLHLSGAASGVRVQRSISSDAGLRSTTTLGDFACGTGIGSATNCWNVYDIAAVAERMRIDSSGNLLVGTTSGSGNRLDVVGGGIRVAASGTSFNLLEIQDSVDQSGATYVQFINSTGGNIGNITRVTTTNAVAYNTTSDYRLKTVTGSVTGQGERIDALKPIDYQWKEGNTQARGFLAHEFQTVYWSYKLLCFCLNGQRRNL
jgi:hypothetical protein